MQVNTLPNFDFRTTLLFPNQVRAGYQIGLSNQKPVERAIVTEGGLCITKRPEAQRLTTETHHKNGMQCDLAVAAGCLRRRH